MHSYVGLGQVRNKKAPKNANKMFLVKCSKIFVQRDRIITPKAKAIKSRFLLRTIIVGALKMEISFQTNIFNWHKKKVSKKKPHGHTEPWGGFNGSVICGLFGMVW